MTFWKLDLFPSSVEGATCTIEKLDRNYKNRIMYILSDNQAAIKTLGKYQITSNLVWDCH
jgi:hypothetical protein